jgi:hypothetical protein
MTTISIQPLPGSDRQIDVDGLLDSGWVYRDIPWMASGRWDEFMDWIGAGNVEILAVSSRDGSIKRGQILISPAGIDNLKQRVEASVSVV